MLSPGYLTHCLTPPCSLLSSPFLSYILLFQTSKLDVVDVMNTHEVIQAHSSKQMPSTWRDVTTHLRIDSNSRTSHSTRMYNDFIQFTHTPVNTTTRIQQSPLVLGFGGAAPTSRAHVPTTTSSQRASGKMACLPRSNTAMAHRDPGNNLGES